MSKAYWISTYQKINDPDKLAAYAALAGPAITAGGGTFIVRGMPVKTYEAGVNERTVVIEFDSIETAIATHDSPGYAAALAALARAQALARHGFLELPALFTAPSCKFGNGVINRIDQPCWPASP